MMNHNQKRIDGKDFTIELLPAFEDNYIFLGINKKTNEAFAVDPGQADVVIEYIEKQGCRLKLLLLTHEHDDHIGGAESLLTTYSEVRVACAGEVQKTLQLNTKRLLNEAQLNQWLKAKVKVLTLPGHTIDHVAFNFLTENFLFSGDILFGLGCGRVIGGTHEQHFSTLQTFKELPNETLIFCAHEYTQKNFNFLKTHYSSFPDAVRSQLSKFAPDFPELEKHITESVNSGTPTIPLRLAMEKTFNPFLNCNDINDFKILRDLRNKF